MGGLVIVTRPFTLLVGIIMARLLAPDDFGVLALSMVFLGSTNLFANLGMGPAIINSDLDRHKVAFHAFVITVISSLLLLTFTVTNAEWLAQILGDQTIAPVLRVLSLLIVFNSWETVPESFLKKDLQFDAIAKGARRLQSRQLFWDSASGVWSLANCLTR
jgi:PST family polysaccharide transporter